MRLMDLAARLECELDGDGAIEITGVKGIEQAGPGDLTFVANRKYLRLLPTTRASAVILGPEAPRVEIASLRAANPKVALARALEIFYPPYVPPAGVHPTAVISASARLGAGAYIGPYVVVEEDVVVGDNARIHAHTVIYPGTRIGDNFVAHAGVVVREQTIIGNDVVLQSGAVIGGDGFGYEPAPGAAACRVPQTGRVVLEDGVEIGANTTVDRATVGETVIRRGTKIDNLVMVAHGCEIGEGSFLAAQVGLAGSTKLESGVMMGGQVGAAGHLTVGKNTMVAAQSGIPHSVPPGSVIGGYPAVDIATWRRCSAALPRLPELLRRVRELEKRVAERDKREKASE